jgi:hypothetical protein
MWRPGEPGTARRSRWASMFRIAVELALLFGIAIAAKQALVTVAAGSYPNPLWLPVIVLSLQHGVAAGLAAAVIAAGVQYWGGLPPALMTEDMYSYIGRIAAEPVGWTCVALLIGHIRSRQIAQTRELEAELAERSRHSTAVAAFCEDLRNRTELLERHIAANAHSSNIDVAEAVSELHHATWDNFAQRLTRFVILMTGAAEFSIYVLADDVLKLAFQPGDQQRPTADVVVPSNDPLFAAVVTERRILSATSPDDAALLGQRGILAVPLTDSHAPERVIGMLAIGETALDDHPDDVGRRVALTCSQLSRLAGRISLIDRWHAATAPAESAAASPTNGHGATPGAAAPHDQGGGIPPAGREQDDREMTLQ